MIIRLTVIFGGDLSTLINNIAWILRRFPVFAAPGDRNYKLQTIFIEDLVDLAVDTSFESKNLILDAIGPELFTYNELVRLIANKIGRKVKSFMLNQNLPCFLQTLLPIL